jgi:hypothetical protein
LNWGDVTDKVKDVCGECMLVSQSVVVDPRFFLRGIAEKVESEKMNSTQLFTPKTVQWGFNAQKRAHDQLKWQLDT